MRLTVTKTNNANTYYVIRSIKRDGKRSSEVVEKLGTDKAICEKYNVTDAYAWAKDYVNKLNESEKQNQNKILLPFHPNTLIDMNEAQKYNIGYLFLQKIFYQLKLNSICDNIAKQYNFSYDLSEILSRLVYGRILHPSSKKSCMDFSKTLLEQPHFQLHDIYRALSVLAKEMNVIQAKLYENSKNIIDRSTGVLYYDCTNYYFEIEEENGIKQYGISKEHRPNPIVQMGLFMDRTGMPLAFNISAGNRNEQLSLIPLEKQIMSEFELSKFVVCTDAGLSSIANRKFNNFGERSFITTQSIKKLSKKYREWALSKDGWKITGSDKTFNIDELEDSEENRNKIFYKECYLDGYDKERDIEFNQTLIVTYSLKYALYQKEIRRKQIDRALNALNNPGSIDKVKQNDYKRFVTRVTIDENGEIEKAKYKYILNSETEEKEAQYDGFYAVCTNLEDDVADILDINKKRWEIEESFRIMKTDFEARPIYLHNDDRIKAHFLTCYIALLIYRILEKQLDNEYTISEIISTLQDMHVTKVNNDGYIPSYTRTQITDKLHEISGFRTDYQLTTHQKMKGILSKSKK